MVFEKVEMDMGLHTSMSGQVILTDFENKFAQESLRNIYLIFTNVSDQMVETNQHLPCMFTKS